MSDQSKVFIFGEVLFDCFPTGEQVLGGAPFNVAWHLQALGAQPQFISRVGDDELGKIILNAMNKWGMNTSKIQVDPMHRTGRVEVKIIKNEPYYNITPDCAYDFIDFDEINNLSAGGILYHGTLGVRHKVSRKAFMQLSQNPDLSIFLDVNLRSPWWQKEEVYYWLENARWVKLNEDELRLLGSTSADIEHEMSKFQSRFHLEQVILTRGEKGAMVCTNEGQIHNVIPEQIEQLVDTVGAGDAFSAIYIKGLISDWSLSKTLYVAQQFAAKVIGLRGAISTDPFFYQDFIDEFI
ncbi:MAG: carbohydrate kinase [Desulfobacterales bacterium]|nr:carbohydrate kinase [Desulfobacterales bacterium]